MELIKKEGGYALFKSKEELRFVDYKSSGLNASIFVFGLIALITLSNVTIQLLLGRDLAISALLIPGFVCLFLWRKQKMKRRMLESKPLKASTILIVDTNNNTVLSGDRTPLASTAESRFSYDFQMTSSASKLMFHYPKGKILLAKGNPFGGSRKPFKTELEKYNLAKL